MTRFSGSGVPGSSQTRRAFTTGWLVLSLLVAGCGEGAADQPDLVIGGIPDQDLAVLEERFNGVADYLSDQLNVSVRYQASTDYAALVTAFRNGDVPLAWFGGLTGVQARLAVADAEAIIQRPVDAEYQSVFIVSSDVAAESLDDLGGLTFTFGSESSTSGHLMPRYFLNQEGIDPDSDFDGAPGYSGSHDTTIELVEAGSYQAGALSMSVWDRNVAEGTVDTTKVREMLRTDPYFDYHWVAHPDLDATYGEGFTERVIEAFLAMGNDAGMAEVLELFGDASFIRTSNDNYGAIEEVARELGLIG